MLESISVCDGETLALTGAEALAAPGFTAGVAGHGSIGALAGACANADKAKSAMNVNSSIERLRTVGMNIFRISVLSPTIFVAYH